MNRDIRFDVVRTISCFAIVLTHVLQTYGNQYAFWTNSAVCTFYLLSGMLLSNSNTSNPLDWIYKRVFRLLPGYYLVVIPTILIFIKYFGMTMREVYYVIFNLIGLHNVPSGFGHLWFLTGIIFAYVITPFLPKKRKVWQFMLLVIIIVAVYKVNILSFEMSAGLFSYFLGLYFRDWFLKKNSKFYLLLSIFMILFLMINLEFKSSYIFFQIRYLLLGIGSFYLVFHSNLVTDWLIKRWKNIILYFSDLSYAIYLVHGIFSTGPLSVLGITRFNSMNILIYILIVWILSIIVHRVSNKIIEL